MERAGTVFASVTVLLVIAMGTAAFVAPQGAPSKEGSMTTTHTPPRTTGTLTSGSATFGSTTSSSAITSTTGYLGAIAGTGPDESVRPLGTTEEVTLSKDGLNLDLSIISNVVFEGSSVSVTIDEKNPTNGAITVPAASDWPVPGLTLGPCGTLNAPMGFGLLAGYYTMENISTVSSDQLLGLYQPGTYACPAILAGITGYSFSPMSDRAGILQGNNSGPAFPQTMNGGFRASGYWTSTFNTFTPGYYTLVGGDEWGTSIILHFLVAQALSPNEPLPLKFNLSMNTTSLILGEGLSIRSDISNSLPQILSVNETSNWPWNGLMAEPCPSYAGIVILRGHYTQSNFTAGMPLQMYPYGLAIPCIALSEANYVFPPLSDQAQFFGGEAILTMGDALSAYGYYAPGQTCDVGVPYCGNEKVTPFEPGIYTIVAGDEWGQLAFGYFGVTSS